MKCQNLKMTCVTAEIDYIYSLIIKDNSDLPVIILIEFIMQGQFC